MHPEHCKYAHHKQHSRDSEIIDYKRIIIVASK